MRRLAPAGQWAGGSGFYAQSFSSGGGCTFLLCTCLHLHLFHLLPPLVLQLLLRALWTSRRTQGRKSGELTRGQGRRAAVPVGPLSGRARCGGGGGTLRREKLGRLVPSPGGSGRAWRKGTGRGPRWGMLTEQSGRYYGAQGRVRAGRGTGGCVARGAWEGLTSGGLTQSRHEAREGPGMPWTGSDAPSSQALAQRGRSSGLAPHPRKAVPATDPDGGGVGGGSRRTGRQTDRQEARVRKSPTHWDRTPLPP